MRSFRIILSAFIFITGAFAVTANAQNGTAPANPNYDEKLAEELGADDYGMRGYVFCVLKTGPAKIDDEAKRSELFRGHFSNMGKLAEQGKLVLAGPFGDAEPWRGMYIFNVTTIEEAEDLVKSDPAVAAGIFAYELKKLYGSAALMKISEIHSKIQKKKIE
ncbi:MAG TPA: YciI family protein [Aridibacter sp.]|nr:YciI family protein [Aridibacter sp.]